MRINSNYKLREIAGETLIVNQGLTDVNLTRIISLNSSARLMYETLSGKEFTLQDAAHLLCDTYGIGEEQAIEDASRWAEALKGAGVIED